MVKPKPKRYLNPISAETGKRYFVPCVIKNHDALVYHVRGKIMGTNDTLNQFRITDAVDINLEVSSLRFNDILPNGKSYSKLKPNEIAKMHDDNYSDMVSKLKHPENNVSYKDDSFFSLTCPHCGNYYSFMINEMPYETFFCGLCERVIIDYTGVDDWEYEYYETNIKELI